MSLVAHEDRHRAMDRARVRAGMTVQDLWLAYVALGGVGDTFDVEGYLHGLVVLDEFQEDVLAQAVNEGLADAFGALQVPLSSAGPDHGGTPGDVHEVVQQFLGQISPDAHEEPPTTDRP